MSMVKKNIFSFRLTDEAYQNLKKRAEQESRNLSNMLDYILKYEIKKENGTKNNGAKS